MKIAPHPAGWDGITRRDGTIVMQTFESTWVVLPRDERQPIDVCPCCKRFFTDMASAQHAANDRYPLPEPAP